MARFDRRDLEGLIASHPPPCVSVLLPTPRRVTSGDRHAVRLRNLLRQAEEQLPEAPERVELLAPIAALARSDAWASSAEGLALFRSPGFFRAIDRALWTRLRRERAPLVLAGVAAHWPPYRQISRYPHVASEGIEGNPFDLGPDERRERAAPLARDLFRARGRTTCSTTWPRSSSPGGATSSSWPRPACRTGAR